MGYLPNDSLSGISFSFDGTDFYATKGSGADAVIKKLDSDSKHGFANYSSTNYLVVECGFKPTSIMVVSTDNNMRQFAYKNVDKNLLYYASKSSGVVLTGYAVVTLTDTGFVVRFTTYTPDDGQEFEWFASK